MCGSNVEHSGSVVVLGTDVLEFLDLNARWGKSAFEDAHAIGKMMPTTSDRGRDGATWKKISPISHLGVPKARLAAADVILFGTIDPDLLSLIYRTSVGY